MKGYTKQEPETIQALFNSIAKQYDRTNAALSFNMHKGWNKALIDSVITPAQPKVLLDLCCGTGAIAFDYLSKATYPVSTYMLDFSEGMLSYAKEQAKRKNLGRHDITYLQADAQTIPLLDCSVDCATIAYGIRNVKDPQKCINESYRVLKRGGTFGILELTQPRNVILKAGHSIYLKAVLPVMGKLLTSNKEAYKYLCNSINTFIPPKDLERLLHNAGFHDVERKPLSGGIATLLIGKKN